jgi:hypothetical protein
VRLGFWRRGGSGGWVGSAGERRVSRNRVGCSRRSGFWLGFEGVGVGLAVRLGCSWRLPL